MYVVLTSEYPRITIIDEPQSFLHPGAIRKLFDVLKRESRHQHQYIVTTYSPNVVTAAEPQSLVLVRKIGAESTIAPIDVRETKDLRFFLDEVGARLGDVFGADDILWVEGATEERCFPLILEWLRRRPLLGTAILGVRHTGDLAGRQARASFEIYRRLSSGRGLLPPAVGFIFDREGRSEIERNDLIRESGGTVRFLPRRMYENYLLNPKAVAAVASSIDGFADTPDNPTTSDQVEDWLNRHRWRRDYLAAEATDRTEAQWLVAVDGAKLLKDMFSDLSSSRVTYDKVVYGVQLTQWLLENAPHELGEVAELIEETLEGAHC